MSTLKRFYLLAALCLLVLFAHGQIPAPATNDPNWNNTPQFSTDFTATNNLYQWDLANAWTHPAPNGNVILVVPTLSISGTYSIGDGVIQYNPSVAVGIVSAISIGSPNSIITLNASSGKFVSGYVVTDQITSATSTPSTVQTDITTTLTVGTITNPPYILGEIVSQTGGAIGILWSISGSVLQILPLNTIPFNYSTLTGFVSNASSTPSSISSGADDNVVVLTGAITSGPYLAGETVNQAVSLAHGTLCGVVYGNAAGPNALIIKASNLVNFDASDIVTGATSTAYSTASGIASATCYADNGTNITSPGTPGNYILQLAATYTNTFGSSPVSSGQMYTNPYYQTFSYGYYETDMELSCQGIDYNDAFWLYNCDVIHPPYVHNELDCEMLSYSSIANIIPVKTSPIVNYSTNIWIGTCGRSSPNHGSEYIPGLNLGTAFHKYSFEWTPDHIIWYFDGIPFRTVHYADAPNIIPSPPMNIWLSLGFGPNVFSSRDVFPGYMYVKYVSQFNLNNSNCLTLPYQPSVPFSPAAFNQVYKYITLGNSFGSINNSSVLSSSTTVYMRAAGNTTIYGPFTVPAPSSGAFAIIPTACF